MAHRVIAAAMALAAPAAQLGAQARATGQGDGSAGTSRPETRPTIVLVHGGFVDGSGWQGVFDLLRKDGFTVRIVQSPTITLEGDVAATRAVIDAEPVYIAAFAPDAGESVASLIKDPPPGAPVPPIVPQKDGFLLLDRAKFAHAFAADVEPGRAEFMAESPVPWGVGALNGAVTTPAWRSKPSWYLLATQDRMIPPDAQRMMAKRAGATAVEAAGSHSIYVSSPKAVANLIESAARKLTGR